MDDVISALECPVIIEGNTNEGMENYLLRNVLTETSQEALKYLI